MDSRACGGVSALMLNRVQRGSSGLRNALDSPENTFLALDPV